MERIVQVRVARGHPQDGGSRPGSEPGWVPTRPSWAVRLAVVTFLVVIALPVLILFGVAVAAAVIVFGGIALLTAAGRRIRRAVPGHDGRVNVRVRRD